MSKEVLLDARVLEFGQALLEAGDLDPVYNYLAGSKLDEVKLKRWLLAYSMFYHAGLSNQLAVMEVDEFWKFIKENLRTLPRGEERRHYRGEAAIKSVESLSRFAPEDIVDYWYMDLRFKEVLISVQKLPLYGPWIAFKMADMGERVLQLPIDFSDCELSIYREPRIGAAIVLYGDEKHPIEAEGIRETVDYITSELNAKGFLAPPWNDRPLNVQEAETILCKFKSHLHGHYPVGKDVEAVQKALQWTLPLVRN